MKLLSRLLLIASVSAAALFAQATGRLSGTVLDTAGSAIPGAVVSLTIPGGTAAAATTTTSAQGFFAFTGLSPVTYDLVVEARGFQKTILRSIQINSSRENSLPPITLEIEAVNQVIEVSETLQGVQTANAEVSNIITNEAFRNLPQLNRNPLVLMQSQAGINTSGRTNTTVNGLRSSYVNVTLDGINVQDNFIRTNTVDFSPNRMFSDAVAEVTVSTSNSNASVGNGAAQINFVTPSGTNQIHGSVYWFNRNNKFAANNWFNNRDGVRLPFLNQNQLGFTLGGPAIKNKLFFYGNYEKQLVRQQASYNRTILTGEARAGIFTYEDAATGQVRKANILQLMGISPDPVVRGLIDRLPPASAINNFDVGDSRATLLRNTAGYRFVRSTNTDVWNMLIKGDYILSAKNAFSVTWMYTENLSLRPDVTGETAYSTRPTTTSGGEPKFLSARWRTNPSPSITNELSGGFNLSPVRFDRGEPTPEFFVAGLNFTNPDVTFMPQGRFTNTWNMNDNFSIFRGAHTIQGGFQGMFQRVTPYNAAGIVPTYTLGISANQRGLVAADLPGIRAQDLTLANNMLATLGGIVSSYSQTFNVRDRNSGFVAGQDDRRQFLLDTYSWYLTDRWKINRRLTFNYGVRWEYITVLDEKNGLYLLPALINNNPISSLMTANNTLDFAGKAAGRPYYNADRNNFAPNVGLAWDIFGDGKTALRAGYSMNFVNDAHITALRNNLNTNAGLQQVSQQVGFGNRTLSANRPAVVVPVFRVPRSFADNVALNALAAFGMPDPGLVTPYVQQWNLSIQREIKGGVLELRYVGNKTTQAFRAFDYNQVEIRDNNFLPDFITARNAAFANQAATGNFAVPAGLNLPVFSRLGSGGLLTNATVLNLLQTGQAGELAHVYFTNNLSGSVQLYPVPVGLGRNMMTNYSNASYNALQVDYLRRFSRGFQAQFNYVYSKVMSDAAIGDANQSLFEPFLDIRNAALERARTPYDITHAIKGNFVFELPVGAGKRFSTGRIGNLFLGGWKISGLVTRQSGSPFSIMSRRGTLNRGNRSDTENGTTASSTLTKAELDKIVAFNMTGRGPFMIVPSAIGPDGRGVAADGRPAFNGQAFQNPEPGGLGTLQRRMFSGPWWFNLDFGAIKSTKFAERYDVELRMESTNFFNNPAFYLGDQDINSVNFGRITSAGAITAPRRIQFGLYVRF
jgi:hypothetical protein